MAEHRGDVRAHQVEHESFALRRFEAAQPVGERGAAAGARASAARSAGEDVGEQGGHAVVGGAGAQRRQVEPDRQQQGGTGAECGVEQCQPVAGGQGQQAPLGHA